MTSVREEPRHVSASAGEGELSVTLELSVTEAGVAGFLFGGTLPHVGGSALAAPGPELHGTVLSHVDLWVSTVPGHKDAEVAAAVAKRLCAALGCPVSIAAGVHVDNATGEQIRALSQACTAAANATLAQLAGE